MTDSELDDLLRRALLDAVREDYAQELAQEAGEEVVPFSPGYLRRRRKLLSNPFAYAKRCLQPAWRRALRTAACLLLAAGVATAGVLYVNPEARAWVQRVVVEWFETYTSFRFTDEPEEGADLGEWRPTYLPINFQEIESQKANYLTIILFENPNGEYIRFSYLPAEQGRCFNLDNEDFSYDTILINERLGSLFTSNNSEKANIVVWTDNANRVSYKLESFLSPEELILIAESIILIQ